MKNNLADLNNHLFAMLEEIEEGGDPRELENSLKKARAMCDVSRQILSVANVQVKAMQLADRSGYRNDDLPALIAVKDSRQNQKKAEASAGGKVNGNKCLHRENA